MSHFSLGVITKDKPSEDTLEKLLEPFSAHKKVKTITPKRVVIHEAQQELLEYKESDLYQSYLEDPEEYRKNANPSHLDFIENEFPKLLNYSEEDLFLHAIRYHHPEDITDNSEVISYSNPNTKWDWWVVGGRWENYIRTKDGKQVNTSQISNMVIDDFHEDSKVFNDLWENIVEGEDVKIHEIFPPTKEFLVDTYGTKDNYINTQRKFRTYALLLPDGEWIEPGSMGPFGLTDYGPESKKEYIKQFGLLMEEYNDHYLTIVDCHI